MTAKPRLPAMDSGAAIGPSVETERLILRPPTAEDFEPWVAFGADAEVARFLGGVQTPAMVWRTMCAVAGAWTINGFSMFSVVEKASGRWIGRLGPWMPVIGMFARSRGTVNEKCIRGELERA